MVKRTIKAKNVKVGDVYLGQRVKVVHQYKRRTRRSGAQPDDNIGVAVILAHRDGYDIQTVKFVGSQRIPVNRPKYNLPPQRRSSEQNNNSHNS